MNLLMDKGFDVSITSLRLSGMRIWRVVVMGNKKYYHADAMTPKEALKSVIKTIVDGR